MRTVFAPVLAVALSTAFLGFAAPANAAILDACGRVDVSVGANCEMRVEGGCTTSCTPVNFTAQCSAELYVGCNGMCTVNVEASCTTSCKASCATQCQVDPGKFDCAASCRADCGASCDATCSGSSDSRCRSSCESTCAGRCDARCEATPPSADCNTKCEASCTGSCDAQANMDCQVQCQSKGYVDCETKLEGGCKTACSKPDGALFCDGQFIDVSEDQLDKCVAQLKEALQIEVKFYAEGDAQCSRGTCTAEGSAGFSCAQSGAGAGESSSALGMLGAIAAFGLAFGRRKKARA